VHKGLGLYATLKQSWAVALAEGVAASGLPVIWQRGSVWSPDQCEPFDVVVSFGARGRHGELITEYNRRGIPVLVQDLARWRALEGHIGMFLGSLHGLPPCGVPGRRETLLPDAIQPIRRKGDHVLVLAQKPHDASHRMDERALSEWLSARAREVAERLGLPIVFRPHPKGERYPLKAPHTMQEPVGRPDFVGTAHVVTYCSTGGLEALMAGVPVTCDPCAFYAPWADFSRSREDLLDRILATQWSHEELRDGTAWAFAMRWVRGELTEAPVVVGTITPKTPKKARRKVAA
jgi:hypothetical protein